MVDRQSFVREMSQFLFFHYMYFVCRAFEDLRWMSHIFCSGQERKELYDALLFCHLFAIVHSGASGLESDVWKSFVVRTTPDSIS